MVDARGGAVEQIGVVLDVDSCVVLAQATPGAIAARPSSTAARARSRMRGEASNQPGADSADSYAATVAAPHCSQVNDRSTVALAAAPAAASPRTRSIA